jgi:hypothetical protein
MSVDLDDLEAKARRATGGRWQINSPHEDWCWGIVTNDFGDHTSTVAFARPMSAHSAVIDVSDHDAAYIAAASPDVVLELVAEVRRLRERHL